MTITPDQARQLLAAHTPGNYSLTMGARFPTGVAKLALAAPDLARTIAGMEWEYGLRQPRPEPHAEGELYTSWGYRLFAAKATFARLTDRGVECHIVRRLVGPVEVVEG